MLPLIFLILGAIFFGIGAFGTFLGLQSTKLGITCLGLLCWVVAVILTGGGGGLIGLIVLILAGIFFGICAFGTFLGLESKKFSLIDLGLFLWILTVIFFGGVGLGK